MAAQRVGVVGLGAMGKPMARRLVQAGFTVGVWNRNPAAARELEAEGARVAASPRALAAECDVTITMVPDGPDVRAVMLGDDGVLAGAPRGATAIDTSTIAPAVARELAAAAAQRGVAFLDAPVSGGPEGARTGALSIMVGGDADALARAQPVLAALGTTIVHCGPSGAGQVVKACNQLVVATNIAALSEALVLAEREGVDPHTVVRVLGGGLANSRVLELRGTTMADDDYTVRGKAAYQRKDLGIILDLARRRGVALPVTAIVDQLYTALVAAGDGELDHTALKKTIAALSE
jgi:2-hydroxy-3-oxopropionate reductase